MKCFIQLSKAGDIISILPILLKESQESGENARLLVGKDYAGILSGCKYVDPLIWKGANEDLPGAIRHAKSHFSEVISLQTHGIMPVQQKTPGFQLDQWKRADCENHFEDWPLVFDNRNKDREDVLLKEIGTDKFILFGDHSQSSPFLQKEELYRIICDTFPNFKIVRLSEIRAKMPYDLLGLYDRAALLVTVETMHLHLSRASKVPTVALAANGWRGSSFQNRFAFYLRYSEWDRRKNQMIEAMKNAVSGRTLFSRTTIVPTEQPNGYNLSSIIHNGERHSIYRAHTQGNWKTELFLNDKKLIVDDSISDNSIEDARLFVYNNRLNAAYTVATVIGNRWGCYIAYGEIVGNKISHIRVDYSGNNMLGMNKNWVPFVQNGNLHFIYGIKGQDQIALRVDGDKVLSEYKSPAPKWEHGEIRGGCIIPHEKGLLRFFHSREDYPNRAVRYFVGASIMEYVAPFKTISISTKPVFEGDETYRPWVKHWKANVVFPLGISKEGDDLVLSYGKNDCQSCLIKLNEKDLNL